MRRFYDRIVGTTTASLEIRVIQNEKNNPFKLIVESGDIVSMMSSTGNHHDWSSEIIGLGDFPHLTDENQGEKKQKKKLFDSASTGASMIMGENPQYMLYTARKNGATILLNQHQFGKLIKLNARDGGMIIRKSGFFAGQAGIMIDVYHVRDIMIGQMMYEDGSPFMQKITGKGFYWIEVEGEVSPAVYLYPGETLMVAPKKLIAFQESIDILGIKATSEDAAVRSLKNRNYDLVLRADSRGGFVYLATVDQNDHHRKAPQK